LLSKTTISAPGRAVRRCAITVPIAAASLKQGIATAMRGEFSAACRFVTAAGITERSTAFLVITTPPGDRPERRSATRATGCGCHRAARSPGDRPERRSATRARSSLRFCLGQPVLRFDPVILGSADVARAPKAKPPDLLDQRLELLHPVQMLLVCGDPFVWPVADPLSCVQEQTGPDVDIEGPDPGLLEILPDQVELLERRVVAGFGQRRLLAGFLSLWHGRDRRASQQQTPAQELQFLRGDHRRFPSQPPRSPRDNARSVDDTGNLTG